MSQDNININVQETNDIVNIVSSEVTEVIDINVTENTEQVTLNITEELIEVNINKVTNISPVNSVNGLTGNVVLDIPTATSDLTNDSGFITASQVPTVNDATASVKGILKLTNDLGGTADLPTVPGLANKVPYTGATTNVNLGEYELKAGQVTLDTTPTGTAAVATTRWNDTIGSSETTLKGGNVILKNGVDLVARIVNKVTPNTTLLRANYQAVRISGAQGQRLAVAYAQANNDNNSADTIGLVCEDIATNQEGFIITVGQLLDINTTGSLQGETWADGDVLYLSPTTAGKITNIKPTGNTGHLVVIGYVEYAHAIHGSIYVKIMNGWELDELHNVYISSVADKQLLSYDSASSLWKNKSVTTDDIADSTNKRYVTDANLTTIGNQSGTNTGDETTATIKTKLGAATTSVDGYLTSTDWSTFNSKIGGSGTTDYVAKFTGTGTLGISSIQDQTSLLSINKATTITDIVSAGSGSLAGSALTINQTWNTTGLPTSILLNVTKTAVANYSAKLIDLKVGGASKFNVDSNGNTTIAGGFGAGSSSLSNLTLTNVNVNSYGLYMAHTLNATSGVINIIKLTPTYNQTSGTASNTDIFVNRTETAVGSGAQLLIDLQVGGVSKFKVDNKGLVTSLTITNRQTASYTLALTDNGKLVETNVATANNVTIPLNSSVAFPIGAKIDVVQYGAGQTTFVATSGVTIRSANNWLKINAQYGAATLTKIGTDEWYLWGNLNA